MNTDLLLNSIIEGLSESVAGRIHHYSSSSLIETINHVWEVGIDKRDGNRLSMPAVKRFRIPAPGYQPPQRPPPWYVGMSSEFTKSITGIDRKLQGRILQAISEITQDPTVLRGDTIKPLTGQLQGCWRYRLGDHRLVYSPDNSTGNVTLLAFASRGSIYVD